MKNKKITLDDIIFENRNKEYGAYFLRQHYREHLTKAFVMGTSSVFLFLLALNFYLKKSGSIYSLPSISDDGVTINIKDWTNEPKKMNPQLKKNLQLPQIQQKSVLPPVAVSDNTRNEVVLPNMTQLDDYLIGAEDIAGIPNTDGMASLAQPTEKQGEGNEELAKVAETDRTFEKAEVDPSFVGGISEMYKYLSSKLNYPKAAQRVNLEGKVFVKFVVEKDGSIGSVEILKGIGFGCDEEAVRVIQNMPKWNPGKQNGQNVRVYYTMQIRFKLD